jgi:hypothetical protein
MGISLGDLVGRWRKVHEDESSASFPREVEFFADRTYRGTHQGPRRPDWDEASFDVVDGDHVQIETSNDRKVIYSTRLDRDELTFVAGDRRVTYRRVA